MMKKSNGWHTLEGILNQVWRMLHRGVGRSNDPFHWPVLGTTGEKGCNQRTVILRQFLQPERVLVCYTDSRSEKVKEIMGFPLSSWLFYHPKKKIQLRITGPATLHGQDTYADELWRSTPAAHRLNYSSERSPGTSIDSPSSGLPAFLSEKIQTVIDSENVREHFMAISCRIDKLDWLRLSPLGNRRAVFEWHDTGVTSTWLVP